MTPTEVNACIERLGISESKLAQRLGVAQSTVNRWTTGRRRPPPFLRRALTHLEEQLEQERRKKAAS